MNKGKQWKWNKKIQKELDKQGSPPLVINLLPKNLFSLAEYEKMNKIEIAEKLAMKPFYEENENLKGGAEIQRIQMRRNMGLTDTEGMTITEENLKKLMADLSRATPVGIRIILGRKGYEDFPHFCSDLINKYFTKVKERR